MSQTVPVWFAAVAVILALGLGVAATLYLVEHFSRPTPSIPPPLPLLDAGPNPATIQARKDRDLAVVQAVKNDPDPGAALEADLPKGAA